MALYFRKKWKALLSPTASIHGDGSQEFRSDAALELMAKAREEKTATCSTTTHLSQELSLPSLLISSTYDVVFLLLFCLSILLNLSGLRISEWKGWKGVISLIFLACLGLLRQFRCNLSASKLNSSAQICCDQFPIRKFALKMVSSIEDLPEKVKFFADVERSSSNVVYEHFTSKLVNLKSGKADELLDLKNRDSVEMVLKHIEDADLRRWSLPVIKAFNTGLNEKHNMLNCITNPHFYGEVWATTVDGILKSRYGPP